MRPLYKYLPSEAARSVCESGTIRIGTLYSYRQVERFGFDVGDRNEGGQSGLVLRSNSEAWIGDEFG